MGRYKKVEIKGLFFENFEENFTDAFVNALKNSDLSDPTVTGKVVSKFEAMVTGYEEIVSAFYLEKHKFKLDVFLTAQSALQNDIVQNNRSAFEAFIIYVNTCVIVYDKIIIQLKRKKIDSILRINVSLYGLIIRRAQEIVDLLLSGFIDGAMIIWRSMYENSVILLTLASENDNQLAEKFYEHSLRNSQRKVESFNKHYVDLNQNPLPKSTHENLVKSIDRLTQKYGKSFLDQEYGWAQGLFEGKQKASFRALEDKVEMQSYRPYYLLCCEQTHSNFNGFKDFMVGNKIMLPQFLEPKIDISYFIDPMQFTVSILHEINDYILYEFSTPKEYDANVLFSKKIFEKLQASYGESKNKLKKQKRYKAVNVSKK